MDKTKFYETTITFKVVSPNAPVDPELLGEVRDMLVESTGTGTGMAIGKMEMSCGEITPEEAARRAMGQMAEPEVLGIDSKGNPLVTQDSSVPT